MELSFASPPAATAGAPAPRLLPLRRCCCRPGEEADPLPSVSAHHHGHLPAPTPFILHSHGPRPHAQPPSARRGTRQLRKGPAPLRHGTPCPPTPCGHHHHRKGAEHTCQVVREADRAGLCAHTPVPRPPGPSPSHAGRPPETARGD